MANFFDGDKDQKMTKRETFLFFSLFYGLVFQMDK